MDTKDNLEVFFRIHFALSDDILEDLLPRFKKLDMRSPLLGKIRRQLDESGPCVMLLNKIFNKPNTTKPSAEVQARADYLEKLFNILVQVRTKLSDELEFKSLMAAIIAYHKKQTTYAKACELILNVTNDVLMMKDMLEFLGDKAIHYPMPYVAGNSSSDDEFMFDDLSDGEGGVQTRVRVADTVADVLKKVEQDAGDKGDWALDMFLNDVLSRDEFLMFCPSTEYSRMECDPVAIGQHVYVTQFLNKTDQGGYRTPIPVSYVAVPDEVAANQVGTGASMVEEFLECRKYVSTCIMRGVEDTTKTHPNVDAEQSLPYVVGACELLHDAEIDSDTMYNATLDVMEANIHMGLIQPFSEIYGLHGDDIFDMMKSYNVKCPTLVDAMKTALEKYGVNYYRSINGAYLRLTQEAVRWYPHPEKLPEALEFVREKLAPEVIEKISALLDQRSCIGEDIEMQYKNILYLTKFSKFYKLFLRKFYPLLFIPPPLALLDASIDWGMVYESFLLDVLKSRQLTSWDTPEVRLPTPILDKLLSDSIEDLNKPVYPVQEDDKLPVKKVRFIMKGDILVLDIVEGPKLEWHPQ